MAFARVYTAQTEGLSGRIVTVEVDTSRGLNAFTIVGLGDRAVEEARDRVGSALKNAGYESPKTKNQKTVVSLSPAELRKEGAQFDLAIALGFLISEGLPVRDVSRVLIIGELALDGVVRSARGVLALAFAAREGGFSEMYVPVENVAEAALVEGVSVYGVSSLRALVDHLRTDVPFMLAETSMARDSDVSCNEILVDFADIAGQESAKRGLTIAAAGGHNVIMHGPPGTGKTMLARALVGIMPRLDSKSALEVASIASVAGTTCPSLRTDPPFRAPHHTSSYSAVVGGGSPLRPGEITLAHKGVLFLDELPEFDRRVLEGLRQPLEERIVSISRTKGSAVFPASFILVAAMNPCPCGYRGTKVRPCICAPVDIARYRRKVSGPLLDRVDIALYVSLVAYERLSTRVRSEPSEAVRYKITLALERAYARATAAGLPATSNAEIDAKHLSVLAPLNEDAKRTLNECAERLGFSARAYHRTQRLARTIADIDGIEHIQREHILEAIRYRPDLDGS